MYKLPNVRRGGSSNPNHPSYMSRTSLPMSNEGECWGLQKDEKDINISIMELSLRKFSFIIPSVYDGRKLECRIFLPPVFQNIQSASICPIRGAIVAHPYAPLGGCYDDPVVNFVSSELLRANYVVGTFNFRYDLPSTDPSPRC